MRNGAPLCDKRIAFSKADHLSELGRRFRIASDASRISGIITPGEFANAVIKVPDSVIKARFKGNLMLSRSAGLTNASSFQAVFGTCG